jgi:putative ABC transport system permease protein
LFGEQGLITLLAIPLGWAIGYALAAAVVAGLQTETFRIPFVVSPQTFVWAAAGTLASAVLSGWLVGRRLERMDLIEVLKTRE